MSSPTPHLLLAGGGLANCLIALRLKQSHPDTSVTILEAGAGVGGNHTWSFHAGDLSPSQHEFVRPMIRHRWPAQEVRFPRYQRRTRAAYASITSDALRDHVQANRLEVRASTRVNSIGADYVDTDAHGRLNGTAVIDGRGQTHADGLVLGFQKFVGREVETERPHGIDVPVIMDATVSQADGYRFVYLLPFTDTTLLIEDTRYSDGAALDDADLSAAIDDYAAAQGWSIRRTIREERGILPILIAADFDRFWPAAEPVARAGLRAALFHPTTGYSLPQALNLADAISEHWPMDGPTLAAFTRAHARRLWKDTAFFRVLNRFLFRAGEPDRRYEVMQRFYTLSEPLIENFYAARLPLHHKARIVVGKPPVPFFKALAVIPEGRILKRPG